MTRLVIASLFLCLLCAGGCTTARPATSAVPGNVFRPAGEERLVILEYAADETYGYSREQAIHVGGVGDDLGPVRERLFLNALTGPAGEPIRYRRVGSCCSFATPNGFGGGGLLDMYEVTYDGMAEPKLLYLNMYDEGEVYVPVGFAGRDARPVTLR